MAERFHALDVETANPNFASVCSIGIVTFEDGREVDRWYSLVDPEDRFDPFNLSIHGIREADVRGAPTLRALSPELHRLVYGSIVVTHSAFDRAALHQAHDRCGATMFQCRWLDSSRVIRWAWPEEFGESGYGLAKAAEWAGIEFGHHHAEEDARAAGLLVVKAVQETGLSVEEWLTRAALPAYFGSWGSGASTGVRYSSKVTMDGDPEGPLHGEVICFTGALTIPRKEAAQIAAQAGCDVRANVSNRTTILVVGQQDLSVLAGHEKSSKHRMAEELRQKGHPIRIVGERDFLATVGLEAGDDIPEGIPEPIHSPEGHEEGEQEPDLTVRIDVRNIIRRYFGV